MKKILLILLCIVLCLASVTASAQEDLGLSMFTYDELVLLRDLIDAEIAARDRIDAKPSSFGMWEIADYTDEFDIPTGEQYVCNYKLLKGTFSSSVANDRDLSVRLIVDTFYADIILYQYGEYQVKNISSLNSNEYTLVMMDGDQNRFDLKGSISANGDRLRLENASRQIVLNALQKGGCIQFAIENKKYTTEKYRFTIENADGFSNTYDELLGDMKGAYTLPTIHGYYKYKVGIDIPEGVYNVVGKISMNSAVTLAVYPVNDVSSSDSYKYEFDLKSNILHHDGIKLTTGDKLDIIGYGGLYFIPQ